MYAYQVDFDPMDESIDTSHIAGEVCVLPGNRVGINLSVSQGVGSTLAATLVII